MANTAIARNAAVSCSKRDPGFTRTRSFMNLYVVAPSRRSMLSKAPPAPWGSAPSPPRGRLPVLSAVCQESVRRNSICRCAVTPLLRSSPGVVFIFYIVVFALSQPHAATPRLARKAGPPDEELLGKWYSASEQGGLRIAVAVYRVQVDADRPPMVWTGARGGHRNPASSRVVP